jgi:hypothetical protein
MVVSFLDQLISQIGKKLTNFRSLALELSWVMYFPLHAQPLKLNPFAHPSISDVVGLLVNLF